MLGRIVILDADAIRQPREPRAAGRLRIFAADRDGNVITLIYFDNPGWAKKLLPLGEPRTVSGKLEIYGQELQIVHPDSGGPETGAEPPEREAIYPLSEGHDRTAGWASSPRQALERAPDLAGMDRAGPAGTRRLAPWRAALARLMPIRADERARAARL